MLNDQQVLSTGYSSPEIQAEIAKIICNQSFLFCVHYAVFIILSLQVVYSSQGPWPAGEFLALQTLCQVFGRTT
jgi:hypothetical protein